MLVKKGKSKSGKPRGRSTWAKGSKLELLLSFEDEYLATADPGSVYTRITAAFLEKYGYDLPFDAEPAEDFVAEIPNIAALPYEEQIEEQTRRDEIHQKLRLKISNWMRHRFRHKQSDQDMVADILNTMSSLTAERPRRRTAMNIYWAENYASRIRDEFRKHWKSANLTASSDVRMSMCAEFVRSKYDDETEEFRKNLEKRADAEYAQAMEDYNKRDALDGSPEAYARAWEESDNFLPIFVDAIAKKFRMSVSLLLVGPLGSEQGKIGMRSVHFNNAGSMTSLIWPQYDKTGFTNMQASLIRYGETVFSPEERKRRIPMSEANDAELNTSPSSGDMAVPTPAPISPTTSNGQLATISQEEPLNLIENTFPSLTLNVPMDFGVMNAPGEFTALLGQEWDNDAPLWNTNFHQPAYHLPLLPTQPLPQFPASRDTFPAMGSPSTLAITSATPAVGMPASSTGTPPPVQPILHSALPAKLVPSSPPTTGPVMPTTATLFPTIHPAPITPTIPPILPSLVARSSTIPVVSTVSTVTPILPVPATPSSTISAASTIPTIPPILPTTETPSLTIHTASAMPTPSAILPVTVPLSSMMHEASSTPTIPQILSSEVSLSPTAHAGSMAPTNPAISPSAATPTPTTPVASASPTIPTTPVASAPPTIPTTPAASIPAELPPPSSSPTVVTPTVPSSSTSTPAAPAVTPVAATLSAVAEPLAPPPAIPGSPSEPLLEKENVPVPPKNKKRGRKELAANEEQVPPAPKKRTRQKASAAPATSRPQRVSNLPPHLADVGYVPPSKGTRKQTVSQKKK
ncbi:hypothetical protein PC9H_005808 [Pleurotus ostreatus]|uniref:Uncharacterized protein n=1 Tax=Pleurotus ostreatus TaxID=5322 RepID=A0A8H6ZX51_PLEOS|nr:uncharacterized protein PC9H_005808 [Pleurotus ostreatus]KAF7433842.1 hypothetical protein PC9H_005808 [Pleurotus ostreatus]